MQIEELNKSQIILLTLLISFVTSLATGIVTVSLMEQGVTPVTNTVNKIVERTKEVVVKVIEPQDPVIITETKEVVVRQADIVAEAVARARNSFVSIYKVVPAGDEALAAASTTGTSSSNLAQAIDATDALGTTTQNDDETTIAPSKLAFVARAAALGGGKYLTDASLIAVSSASSTVEYVILNASKKRVPLKYSQSHNGIAMMTTSAGGKTITFTPAKELKPGQAVVVLSGSERLKVVTTIIADIIDDVSIELGKSIVTPGSILITMDGRLAGMSTGASRANGNTWMATSDVLKKALQSVDAEPIK